LHESTSASKEQSTLELLGATASVARLVCVGRRTACPTTEFGARYAAAASFGISIVVVVILSGAKDLSKAE
jgi:hypothetical protein